MQAIVLQTTSSYHVASDVARCVTSWGGNLIIKSGPATSDVKDIGLAHVDGPIVSRSTHCTAPAELHRYPKARTWPRSTVMSP